MKRFELRYTDWDWGNTVEMASEFNGDNIGNLVDQFRAFLSACGYAGETIAEHFGDGE